MRTFLCGLMGLMLLPALLRADDYAKFRIPDHTVHSLQASAYGTWENRDNTDQNYSMQRRHDDQQTSLDGQMSLSSLWLKDSERFRLRTQLNFYVDGQANDRKSKQSYFGYSPSEESAQTKTKNLTEQWTTSVDGIYYPLPQPAGIGGRVDARGSYYQRWRNEVQRRQPNDLLTRTYDTDEWDYSYWVSGQAFLGWGRIRDVSGVYDVEILEQRLLENGILTRPLTDESRQKLANLMYFRSDYKAVHERPSRFFWQDVETILVQDGGLKTGGLDAYSVHRLDEPYFEQLQSGGYYNNYLGTVSRFFRQRGYFVGFAAKGTHNHTISRANSSSSTLVTDSVTHYVDEHDYYSGNVAYDVFEIGMTAQGDLPVGPRLQLHGEFEAYAPQHDVRKAMDIQSQASATYLIADRWLANLSVTQTRSILKSWNGSANWYRNQWSVNSVVGVSYFIEDNLNVSLNWVNSQSSNAVGYFNSMGGFDDIGYTRDNAVYIGCTFHLLGKLTAPGLVSASKLPFRSN